MVLVIAILCCGCAASRARHATPSTPQYLEAGASALAFDPPIAIGTANPELARAGRGPSAFLGFDEPTTELYYTATDDLQTNDWGNFYTQESFSVRSGYRTR